MTQVQKTALIMAGGTGGHIFPGLAVAEALREKGWNVHWLGVPTGMEGQIVPPKGFAFEGVQFGGVRGKGMATKLLMPLRLCKAIVQARRVMARVKPDVVIGFGGYITMPGGIAAWLSRVPVFVHEANAAAGTANKWLARIARKVFTAFPDVLPNAQWVGNPLRQAFLLQPAPQQRFAGRFGALRLLVVGGSLGAKALNDIVPQALALLPVAQRPQVLHQSGATQIEELTKNYEKSNVQAELTPFIEDTASAYAQADLVLCRSGASTVTELAAVGAAAYFVPFPYAIDDHQTSNARYLVDADAAWMTQQRDLSAQQLADFLSSIDRVQLLECAEKAQSLAKVTAVQDMVKACEEVAA